MSDPTPMQALLTSIGDIITAIMGWIGDVVSTIISTPLLLIPFAIFVVGACVALFARLFGAR